MQNDSILLASVVRRGRGDSVAAIARTAGAKGSTIFLGRGTASGGILWWLGLADTKKEVVFTVAPAGEMPGIVLALRNAPDLCKKVPGIGFTINLDAFFRSSPSTVADESFYGAHPQASDHSGGNMDFDHKLICVIANTGLADDLMRAARRAGATGGTILRARGTATGQDESFFGITIVPEKEMLMVLAKTGAAPDIIAAIRNDPALAEPGAGIVFSMPVMEFFPLGQSAAVARGGKPI